MCFNPVLGFLVPATSVVYIAGWRFLCFNPVLGFLVPATDRVAARADTDLVFQSRSGFSGSCDEPTPAPMPVAIRFNPVLGFLVPATATWADMVPPSASFNPVLGFLVPATARSAWTSTTRPTFQSRSGFSGSCDRRGRPRRSPGRSVSIPFWVFWFLRRYDYIKTERREVEFQSRSGFSGSCDFSRRSSLVRSSRRFNPVLGFLVPATLRRRRDGTAELFQSRSGFSGSCDSQGDVVLCLV